MLPALSAHLGLARQLHRHPRMQCGAVCALLLAATILYGGQVHAVPEIYDASLSPLDVYAKTTVLNPHLLEDSTAWSTPAGRSLMAAKDDKNLWNMWKQNGRYSIIKSNQTLMPALGGRSSTGVVAIHAALIPGTYKISLAGRNLPPSWACDQWNYDWSKKSACLKAITPEPFVYGNVSTVYDTQSGTYFVTPNFDTLFCTAHTFASDGTLIAAGGDIGKISAKYYFDWMKEGRDVVRLFNRTTMKWTTLPGVKLSEYRWYPTQVQLPDDRVIIVSGFLDDPYRPATAKPAPSIDIFDYKTKSIVARRSKAQLGKKFFTNITPGYQLYPSVYLLPWTDPNNPGDYFLLFYTCRTGQVVRFNRFSDFVPLYTLPGLAVQNMCAAFSAMGSSVILPLRPERGYQFEFAMFGGGTQGKGLDCKGICFAPASNTIFRMKLPTFQQASVGNWSKWQWQGNNPFETMPFGRVFADAVLLPNGKVLVLNGAQRGVPGGAIDGGATARDAAYTAVLYNPEARSGTRVTTLASSTIRRFYHSNALLLPSGDVWVAGSEQSDCDGSCPNGKSIPAQEYRAELFQLPYAFLERPVITAVANRFPKFGAVIQVSYSHKRPVSAATLIPPGANTHSLNMMQRVIFLRVVAVDNSTVSVQLPSWSDRVANPGFYMLWLLDGDVPCKEAAWIRIGG